MAIKPRIISSETTRPLCLLYKIYGKYLTLLTISNNIIMGNLPLEPANTEVP